MNHNPTIDVTVYSQAETDANGVTHATLGVVNASGDLLCQVEDNAAGVAHIMANYNVVLDRTEDGLWSPDCAGSIAPH